MDAIDAVVGETIEVPLQGNSLWKSITLKGVVKQVTTDGLVIFESDTMRYRWNRKSGKILSWRK